MTYSEKDIERMTARFANDAVPYLDRRDAQVCTSAGNVETGDPRTDDGRIWVLREGHNMPVRAYNALAADNGVGHWVIVGEHPQGGFTVVVEVNWWRNVLKGGASYAAHAAAGPQQSPETMRPRNNYTATAAPAATDDSVDGYSKNSLWGYNGIAYICVSATASAADWQKLGSLTSFTLAGDTGSSTITDSNTLTVAGATGLDTSVSGDTVTVMPDFAEFTSDNTPADTDEVIYLTGTTHKRSTWAGFLTTAGTATLIHERGGLEADVSAYNGVPYIIAGTTGQVLGVPIRVRNASGATAAAKEVGYIDPATNSYKTTTTALFDTSKPCVVLVGAADGSDIYVLMDSGRPTVKYTGTDLAAGDYVVFSTTAGKLQKQTAIRQEVIGQVPVGAVIDTGADEAEIILLHNEDFSLLDGTAIYAIASASTSDFVALINGTPSGTTVVYDTISSGNENTIPPSGTPTAKLVLYNTTRGDSAQISSVNTGTNTITLTATVPGTWADNDAITCRSQTNTDTSGSGYFYDLALDSTSLIPANVVALDLAVRSLLDTSGAGVFIAHQYAAGGGLSLTRQVQFAQVASVQQTAMLFRVAFLSRRFLVNWTAIGAGSMTWTLAVRGYQAKVP
mgnify:CR=1 FL=1